MADMSNSLYLHPSDGQRFVVVDKLVGAGNYREWRRQMEFTLVVKGKLGFATGAVKKDKTNETKAEQWDACGMQQYGDHMADC